MVNEHCKKYSEMNLLRLFIKASIAISSGPIPLPFFFCCKAVAMSVYQNQYHSLYLSSKEFLVTDEVISY